MVHAPRLAEGLATLHIKDEGLQPTASLKDRSSAVALARADMEGAEVVTTASTGNAAAGALAGLGCQHRSAGGHFCTRQRHAGEPRWLSFSDLARP